MLWLWLYLGAAALVAVAYAWPIRDVFTGSPIDSALWHAAFGAVVALAWGPLLVALPVVLGLVIVKPSRLPGFHPEDDPAR